MNQPLSFIGEIPWFDVRSEMQRCGWLKTTHSLESHTGHIQNSEYSDQSSRYISTHT